MRVGMNGELEGEGRPFFIVGCGRSGTTFLRSLLIRDVRIAIPLESLFIIDYLRRGARIPPEKIRAWLVNEPEVVEWGIKPKANDLKNAQDVPSMIRKLHRLYAASQGKELWGQKTPRFVRYLPLLQENFPEAVFIHLIRDPRAVVNSLMNSDVHRSTAYHGALRWLQDVQAGLVFAASNPEQILEVHYEDLVQEPEAELAKVFEHIGYDLPPDLLDSQTDNLANYSAFYENIHANLDRPPMTANIDKWKKSLSRADLQLIEALCRSQMLELGYQPDSIGPQVVSSQIFKDQVVRFFRIWQQLWRYLRFRRAYFFHLIHRKIRLGLIWEFLGNINQ